jgi:hypothetical protein
MPDELFGRQWPEIPNQNVIADCTDRGLKLTTALLCPSGENRLSTFHDWSAIHWSNVMSDTRKATGIEATGMGATGMGVTGSTGAIGVTDATGSAGATDSGGATDTGDTGTAAQPQRFSVHDVMIGKIDLTERTIIDIYTKVEPLYAVYRTENRVGVQYADSDATATDQRKAMSVLNGLRTQINGLIDGWRTSKLTSFSSKAKRYDSRVAAALILCLEGDGNTAKAALSDIKQNVLDEHTSWGRFEYLISASVISLISILLYTLAQKVILHFSVPDGNIWLAARAGTVGAFLSIALAIQGRTVLTSLHRRDNIADAALRILVGSIVAGVLILMLSTKVVSTFKIGEATISGSGIGWDTVLVIGFIAGFSERLVPDLLKKVAGTDSPPLEKPAAPPSPTGPSSPPTPSAPPPAQGN